MNNIFFTTDTHFNHANIIDHCDRPFSDVEEMNETMIENWNKKVTKQDIVYHLGDFGFGRTTSEIEEITRRLNGNIHLILGNHDKKSVKRAAGWGWIGLYREVKIVEQRLVLFHYAQRTWVGSHHGAWMLYGHSHGTLRRDWQVKSFDVGVDMWDFTPLSYEEVEEQMKLHNKASRDHHRPTTSIESTTPPEV